MCVIGNLCPDTLEEAKALVPSLAVCYITVIIIIIIPFWANFVPVLYGFSFQKRSKADDDEDGLTDDKIEQMLADMATIKKFEWSWRYLACKCLYMLNTYKIGDWLIWIIGYSDSR